MRPSKSSLRHFFTAIAVAGCLVTGFSTASSLAQGTPGLTIFSGVDQQYLLGYRLDNDGELGQTDRYRLRFPRRVMTLAANQFIVTYPETFRGEFDPDRVALYVNGKKADIEEVDYNADNRSISVYPKEVVAANSRVEIRFSNVRNPNRVGTHYFNAQIRSPGDLPMARYVGTWIISIGGS